MTIKVNCPNGHSLKVTEKYYGRKIKCPKCQNVIQVPMPASDSSTPVIEEKPATPSERMPSGTRPRPVSVPKNTTRSKSAKSSKRPAKPGTQPVADEFDGYEDEQFSDADSEWNDSPSEASALPPRRGSNTRKTNTSTRASDRKNKGNKEAITTTEKAELSREKVIGLGAGLGVTAGVVVLGIVWAVFGGGTELEDSVASQSLQTQPAQPPQKTGGASPATAAARLSEPEEPLETNSVEESKRTAAVAAIPDLVTLPWLPAVELKSPPAFAHDQRYTRLVRATWMFAGRLRNSPGLVIGSDGQPSKLSWRVHLLPYMDQTSLYEKFHIDEPWNSEHNLQLLDEMPDDFRALPSHTSTTGLRLVGGKAGLLSTKKWGSPKDGVQNTVMYLELGESHHQPWTEPDPGIAIATLDYSSLFATCDEVSAIMAPGGSLRFQANTPEYVFRALATRDGGELIDADSVRRWLANRRGEKIVSMQTIVRRESERLQSVLLAFQNYHDSFGTYPPRRAGQYDHAMDRNLSWRVHLLPFLGHKTLFSKFKLDEPWDSPHNQHLVLAMPDVFRNPDDSVNEFTTSLLTLSGPGTPFPDAGVSMSQRDIKDGVANTLSFVSAPRDFAVPWTKPTDFQVDLESPEFAEQVKRLLKISPLYASTFSGAPMLIRPDVSPEVFRAFITPDGGESFQSADIFLK